MRTTLCTLFRVFTTLLSPLPWTPGTDDAPTAAAPLSPTTLPGRRLSAGYHLAPAPAST